MVIFTPLMFAVSLGLLYSGLFIGGVFQSISVGFVLLTVVVPLILLIAWLVFTTPTEWQISLFEAIRT